jgi:uncharacterized protein (TIGR02145 family)
MKNLIYRIDRIFLFSLLSLMFVLPFTGIAQQEGTFKDSRDNRVYQWQKIGKKTWMAENLKFEAKEGSWIYNNDTINLQSFGRLYNWASASTACPKGWVLPSDQDWGSLINVYGGRDLAGSKMQQVDSTNKKIIKKVSETGKSLSTLLGGVRHADGNYTGIGLWGGYWSGTSTADGAKNYLFAHGDPGIGISTNEKGAGFSVRCIKK